MIGAGIPFEVGFRLSKPDLEATAADCIERQILRIGVYHVWRIEVVDAGCMFYTNGGLVDSVGIAYMPDGVPYLGQPRTDGDVGYFPIEGDWYRFLKQF